MIYVFQCESGHVSEQEVKREEFDSWPRNASGNMLTGCQHCQLKAERQYHAARAVYNCSGVYGNMGTDVAFNLNAVHG